MLVTVAACGVNLAGEPEIVATVPPPVPTTVAAGFPQIPPDIAVGASIFAENCTACHGVRGQGDGELVASGQVNNPGDMTNRDAVSVDTPQQWFETITNGNLDNLMPPWREALSEEERWAVALYTYTLGYDQTSIAAGQPVFESACADCDLDFTSAQEMATVSDADLFALLSEDSGDYTDEEIWNGVAYARTLAISTPEQIGTIAEAPAERVEGPFNGQVTGKVTNGTADAQPLDGGTVRLFVLDDTFTAVEMLETDLDDEEFRFEDVLIAPENTYITVFNYQDREFISNPSSGSDAPETGLTLPIQVYEITEDRSVIEIERMVVQVSVQADGLQMAEVVSFRNLSDRLFTSNTPLNDEGTVFGSTVLSLPPGAIVLSIDQDRYIVSNEDFAVIDTQPVIPGAEHIMQVVYLLPYDSGAIIEHQLNYAFDGIVRLLVNPPGMTVDSDQLDYLEDVELANNNYAEYGSTLTLDAGTALRYELNGTVEQALRQASPSGNTKAPSRLAVVLFSLSIISFVLAFGLFMFSRANTPERKRNREIDALVAQIAHMDNQHDAGHLNHDVWRRQRAELKEQLRQLMEEQAGTNHEQTAD